MIDAPRLLLSINMSYDLFKGSFIKVKYMLSTFIIIESTSKFYADIILVFEDIFYAIIIPVLLRHYCSMSPFTKQVDNKY